MSLSNESVVADLVAELDRAIPKEGAAILLQQYGGGPDESKIVGNRLGYLRLGVELLKRGITPQPEPEASRRAALDLRYLLSEDCDVEFDELELSEEVSLASSSPRHGGLVLKAASTVLALAIMAVIGLAFVGLLSLFR